MIDSNDQLVAALAGRYDIERELGHGGMAVVYLARDVRLGRKVALKVLRPELASSVGADRFVREIAIAAPLVHPNIVPLHDSGEAAGCLYYVMPYVEGPTLRQRLDREVQLPIEEALAIARQVAAALDHAHAHGIVHRDIKPENILLLDDHVLVADFGLARAISNADTTTLTNRRLVIGTPPYMSPEQCAPGGQVDGRSDIYSLGCVVFEMIAGMTPFRGATVDVMMAHHLTSEPPSVCIDRSSCPPELDAAVRRALAKVPADRFRTAGELVRALDRSLIVDRAPVGVRADISGLASDARRNRRVAALIVGVGVLATVTAWLIPRTETRAAAGDVVRDTAVIALLPLEIAGAPGSGDTEHLLLFEAFGRWRGVSLVEAFQVSDAVHRLGRPIRTDAEAGQVADWVGAGRYVRARALRLGDTLRVYATLYDLKSRRPLHHGVVHVATNLGNGDAAFARLTDTLLLRGVPADDGPAFRGHRSLPAAQAFAIGDRALDNWDLDAASAAFQLATTYDAGYARAHLWTAQVHAWRAPSSRGWLAASQRAVAAGDGLTERDGQLARALTHLATGEFDRACAAYDSLRLRNDRDFAAWYGLGQCRALDKVVVPDSSSPSGWRFRSSHRQGLIVYERALDLLPSAHTELQNEAYDRLRGLLLAGRDQLISGYSPGSDTARYLARLAWMGDTLALIPYPWARITNWGDDVYPPGFERALAHQRAAFHRIASAWSAALPRSSGAKEALAISLEMLGDRAAADTLRAARRLASDPSRRIQLAAAEALVRVKFAFPDRLEDLRAARAIADSLLSSDSIVVETTVPLLAALAELVGRCERAVELSRRAAVDHTSTVAIPRHYYADAAELLVRSAMGCSRQGTLTVASLSDRLRRDPIFAGSSNRRVAEDILLFGPAQLSLPPDREAIAPLAAGRPRSLLRALHEMAAGDTVAARQALTAIIRSRGTMVPSIDAAYPEARVLLALGDSNQALALLRGSLDGVRTSEPRAFASAGWSGSLMRAMALRAQLEEANGDRKRARTWAAAVADLWSGADQELQPVVRLMQRYDRP